METNLFLKILRSRKLQEVQDYITLIDSDVLMLELAVSDEKRDLPTVKAIRQLKYQKTQLEQRKKFLIRTINLKRTRDSARYFKLKDEQKEAEEKLESKKVRELNKEIEKLKLSNSRLNTEKVISKQQQYFLELAGGSKEAQLLKDDLASVMKIGGSLTLEQALKKLNKDNNALRYEATEAIVLGNNLAIDVSELTPKTEDEIKIDQDQLEELMELEAQQSTAVDLESILNSASQILEKEYIPSTKTNPMVVNENEFKQLKEIEEIQKIEKQQEGQQNENTTPNI